METIILLIPYDKEFRNIVKSGWGCGYLLIPEGHTSINKLLISDETAYVRDFSDEITHCQWEVIGNSQYLKIGFDTAHGYNTPENSGYEFVLNTALELKRIVDSL